MATYGFKGDKSKSDIGAALERAIKTIVPQRMLINSNESVVYWQTELNPRNTIPIGFKQLVGIDESIDPPYPEFSIPYTIETDYTYSMWVVAFRRPNNVPNNHIIGIYRQLTYIDLTEL